MSSTLPLVPALLLVAACVPSMSVPVSTYQRATAGVVGCPSQEITISGQPAVVKSMPVEWRAECRGHRYVCSGSGNVANCKEELQPASIPALQPAAKPAP